MPAPPPSPTLNRGRRAAFPVPNRMSLDARFLGRHWSAAWLRALLTLSHRLNMRVVDSWQPVSDMGRRRGD